MPTNAAASAAANGWPERHAFRTAAQAPKPQRHSRAGRPTTPSPRSVSKKCCAATRDRNPDKHAPIPAIQNAGTPCAKVSGPNPDKGRWAAIPRESRHSTKACAAACILDGPVQPRSQLSPGGEKKNKTKPAAQATPDHRACRNARAPRQDMNTSATCTQPEQRRARAGEDNRHRGPAPPQQQPRSPPPDSSERARASARNVTATSQAAK